MKSLAIVYSSLRHLIANPDISNTEIRHKLRAFRCERDLSVESFLRRYAYTNERNGSTRTYLVLDMKGTFEESSIVAYCSLALTITDFATAGPELRQQFLGNVPKLLERDTFPGYLLAQIGRDSRYGHDVFDCRQLLAFAEGRVLRAMEAVGGRALYLDCRANRSLVGLYERSGYVVVNRGSGEHPVKMAKGLQAA